MDPHAATLQFHNLLTNPPGPEVNKDNLVQRKDDTEEVIKDRLNIFKEETVPLVKQLKSEVNFMEVDGERPIEVIFEDIAARLKKLNEEN